MTESLSMSRARSRLRDSDDLHPGELAQATFVPALCRLPETETETEAETEAETETETETEAETETETEAEAASPDDPTRAPAVNAPPRPSEATAVGRSAHAQAHAQRRKAYRP